MKPQSLKICSVVMTSLLTPYCAAGPFAAAIMPFIAPMFGMVPSAIFYGEYIIVDGAQFASACAVGGTFVGDGVLGGVMGAEAVAASAASSASVESVLSASRVSASSVLSASRASVSSALVSDEAAMRSSLAQLTESQASAMTAPLPSQDQVYTFSVDGGSPAPTPSSTVAKPSGVPPGVPDYNFRLCQEDLISMGKANETIVVNQPEAQSLRVDHIPATCMTLATLVSGDPTLGPHPVAMGTSSLQWNGVSPDNVSRVRQFFLGTP